MKAVVWSGLGQIDLEDVAGARLEQSIEKRGQQRVTDRLRRVRAQLVQRQRVAVKERDRDLGKNLCSDLAELPAARRERLELVRALLEATAAREPPC